MKQHVGEIATGLAWLIGWAALAYGLSTLLGPKVWPFAIAALCFAIGGVELLGIFAWKGIYVLTRGKPRG